MTELPADRIILFDGECGLCASSVRFVLARDQRALFHFAALQSEVGRQLCVRHAIDPDDMRTFVLITPAGALVRSDAALAVLRELGGAWRAIAALGSIVPRSLRDGAYSLLARNRYRWFGRASCVLPAEDARGRFLG